MTAKKKQKFNNEIPKFKSHKVIQALVIASAIRTMKGTATLNFENEDKALPFEPIEVNDAFVRKHNPKAGDVYVVYEDGYVSVSPRKAFDEGYTLLDGKEAKAEDKLAEQKKALKVKEDELVDREKIVAEKELELAKNVETTSEDA